MTGEENSNWEQNHCTSSDMGDKEFGVLCKFWS